MENSTLYELLNQLYVQACEALLSAHGLTLLAQEQRRVTGGERQASYVSILSAGGDDIRLSSILEIDRDLIITMQQLLSPDLVDPDLGDWCRELNNQLVGRVKNKLLGFGPVLVVGLPLLISAAEVKPIATRDLQVQEYFFESSNGQIMFTLAASVTNKQEFKSLESDKSCEAAMLEGAMTLF